MIGRCLNCPVVFIDADAFAAHQQAHNIPAVSPNTVGARLPTTHGSVSVEPGSFASPVGVRSSRTHPSTGRALRGGTP